MNYRNYRTLMLIAVLLLAGIAASLAVQPQSAKVVSANATSFTQQQGLFPHVALRTDDNYYVTAETGGDGKLVYDSKTIGACQTFNVNHLGNNRIALQACNGLWVTAEGGTLLANRNQISEWEIFEWTPVLPSKITLKALKANNGKGKLVSAQDGTLRAIVDEPLDRSVIGRSTVDPSAKFYMEPW